MAIMCEDFLTDLNLRQYRILHSIGGVSMCKMLN